MTRRSSFLPSQSSQWLGLGINLIVLLVGLAVSYMTLYGALDKRLAVMEAKMDALSTAGATYATKDQVAWLQAQIDDLKRTKY